MNKKKFFIAFVIVFVLLEITNYLINQVILMPEYEALKNVFRPMDELSSMLWIMYVLDIVWAFFFVFFFVKGYEGRGLMEGVRYGIYIGLFISLVAAYAQYVVYPITYSVTLNWFVYGLVQTVILGVAAALIYKPKFSINSDVAV